MTRRRSGPAAALLVLSVVFAGRVAAQLSIATAEGAVPHQPIMPGRIEWK